MAWIFAALGLTILVIAGDLLVKGTVKLAFYWGLSPLLVSLTIVSFGTSAPELLIVLSAIYENATALAVGNVIGSNTANILLVLGVPALLMGVQAPAADIRLTYLWMLGAVLLFIGLAFFAPFRWWHGTIMLLSLGIILYQQAQAGQADDLPQPSLEDISHPHIARIVFYILAGLIGLPLGADILVNNAVIIAEGFGVSQAAIGLSLVAVGTSLPELAATLIATYRKQSAVALGNVIGSNMFNMLAIIGIAAFVADIPVAKEFMRFDLWCMFGASLLLCPLVFFKLSINRIWGGIFVALYVTYLWIVLH